MIMRWINRLGTAAILLGIVAGPPLLAGFWLTRHPWRSPTRAAILAWLEQPLTAETIVAGCVGAAVLGWLLLVGHLIRRGLASVAVAWRRMRRMPLPTPAQMTASSMAGVAALTLPTTASATPSLPVVDAPHDAAASDGVELPGGSWVPYPLVAAVAATSTLIWTNRRRRYRPGTPGPHGHLDDPDLQPLPPAAQALTVTPPPSTLPDLAPLAGGMLALTGPGAASAARGLLITAALASTTHGDDPTYRVWASADSLVTLLPHTDPRLLSTIGIDVSHTPPATDSVGTVLVLGSHPTAATRWHVTADGTATTSTTTGPQRVCVLDQQAATDLVDLVLLLRDNPATPQQRHQRRPTTGTKDPSPPPPGMLTLIGDCQLTVDQQPVRLRRSAGLQILAYLAVHPDGADAAHLTRTCWPGSQPATTTQRLHTTLSDLRKQLQPLLGADPILRRDQTYQLNPDAIDTDLRAWRNAVTTASSAIGTETLLRACRMVADLYTGDIAAGHHWPWIITAREAHRREAVDAYAVLADHAPPAAALSLLQQAAIIDPHNDDIRQRAESILQRVPEHHQPSDTATDPRRRKAWLSVPEERLSSDVRRLPD
jgi:DNA-binding SARP family transcriptional activator